MRQLLGPLLVGLSLALVSWLQWGALPDRQARDGFFELRARLGFNPPLDDRLRLIGLDPACDGLLRKPTMLWTADYARVIAALVRGGARVVALDLVIAPSVEALAPGDPVRLRVEEGEAALTLAVLTSQGRVVLAGYLADPLRPAPTEAESWAVRPALPLYGAALAQGNLVAVNVATDLDGTIRALPYLFHPEPPGRPRALFARVFELATEQALTDRNQPLLWLNYPGRPGQLAPDGNYQPGRFPYTPFSALWQRVERGESLSEFKDRICLIGPQAGVWQDLAATPFSRFSGEDTIGLEVHAAGLNSLLTGRGLWTLSGSLAALITLAAALVGGALALRLRPSRSLLAASAGLLGYLTLAFALFCREDLGLPVVLPVLAGVGAYLIAYVQRYARSARERQRVRRVFANMVSPKVMETVLAHPGEVPLGGVRRRVTVLFSDINNFTPQCERSRPEEIIARLNRYFQEMVSIVFRHEGDLKQFVGDEIMAIFGGTHDQPDHAARAVRCGLEMLGRLRELALLDPQGQQGFYDVKIGIHTGEAVVGLVGSEERYEYAAVGDSVNLGARIMGLTKTVGVPMLVSRVTYEEARELVSEFQWTSHGSHGFKGKTETLELFEVTDSRHSAAPGKGCMLGT